MQYIKILGAGPAGLSAAINLANEDYIVDVFKKIKTLAQEFKKTYKD